MALLSSALSTNVSHFMPTHIGKQYFEILPALSLPDFTGQQRRFFTYPDCGTDFRPMDFFST